MSSSFCILDGLFFKPGSTIDFRSLFGTDFVPYNEVTDETIHLSSGGTFVLESGGIYVLRSAAESKKKLHLDKDATSFFRQSNTSLWSLSKKKGKEGSADNLSSTLSLSTSRNFSLSGSLAWLTVDEEDESDDNHVKSRSGSESNNSADQIAKKSTVKRGMTSLFRKKKAVTASSSSIHDNAVLECDENAYDFTSSQTLAGSFNSSVKDSIPNDEQKPIDGQQMERKFKPLQSDEPKVANNEKDDDIDSLNEGIKKKRMTFLEFLLDDAPSPPTGPVPVQEENISKMQDSAPIEPPVKQGSFKLNTSGLPKPYFVVLKTDRLVLYKDESCYIKQKSLLDFSLDKCVMVLNGELGLNCTLHVGRVSYYCQFDCVQDMISWICEINSIGFELRRLGRCPPIDLGIDEQTKDLIHLLSSFSRNMDTVKAEQLCCVKGAGVEPKKSPARPKPMIDDTFDTLHGDSIERIFDRILFSAKPDNRYVNTVIMSHRHFSASPEVLDILANSLDVNFQNELMSLDKKFDTAIRILKYLSAWMRIRWIPDFATELVKPSLFKFCDRLESAPWIIEDQLFSKYFKKISVYIKTIYEVKSSVRDFPTPKATVKKPKINFLNLDPKHCAHSLTKKDKESLRSIRAVEYYHELWEDTRTPIIKNEIRSLRKAIASFNKTCYWIATEICTQPEKSNRALVISQSIKMANVCFKLKNYNTALAIVSGLNALAVSRLKQTWEAVDAKRLKQLEEMESFLSPLSNFKAYRSAMDQHIQSSTASSTPIVPILGIFVKDLVFMNDGNPKFVAGQPEGTVNFDKLRAIYTNVCRMVQLQRTAYPESLFHDIPSQVDGYLENMPVLKEDALYKYSCLCEAKSGDGDTLRLRDKWMKNP